jgi:ferredoxin
MSDANQPSSAPTTNDLSVAPADKATAPGKYKVTVNRPKCIGAASCVAIAPKVFGLDDKQLAFVISEDELDDIKLLAAQSCPTAAIIVQDTTTGEQVWPK